MAFVMVLSYSRDIYLRFFLNAAMENFLRGHVGAFATWRGLSRVLLYDNLKSVVLPSDAQVGLVSRRVLQRGYIGIAAISLG